jgi:hypothetical protein
MYGFAAEFYQTFTKLTPILLQLFQEIKTELQTHSIGQALS